MTANKEANERVTRLEPSSAPGTAEPTRIEALNIAQAYQAERETWEVLVAARDAFWREALQDAGEDVPLIPPTGDFHVGAAGEMWKVTREGQDSVVSRHTSQADAEKAGRHAAEMDDVNLTVDPDPSGKSEPLQGVSE